MKVGDKVFIAVEVEEIEKSSGMFTGVSSDLRTYWYKENQAITQLPIQEGRWMMVSDNEKRWVRRFVVGKSNGLFISYNHINGSKDWIFAKEIPTKTILTMQEIADKFNLDVENIEICTE